MSQAPVLFNTVAAADGARIGIVILNNPATLNALSLTMVDSLYQQLKTWAVDDSIACIVIRGSGDKAFCAGGDIQAMYHAMRENPGQPCPLAEDFFAREYCLDYFIHTYPKPVIVWGNGIVMGGGLGIFMGADFRVVTASARLAMPEITIALYPDVGASFFLNQLPQNAGRFLALTGAAINASDCLALELANVFIGHEHYDHFVEQLAQQRWSDNKTYNTHMIHEIIAGLMRSSSAQRPEPKMLAQMDIIEKLFAQKDTCQMLDEFLAHTTDDAWLERAQATLQKGSPLSARLIDMQLQRSATLSLWQAFKSELILSTNIVRFTEFAEGIRALLIDKDMRPNWHFSNYREIPQTFIDAFFEAPWSTHPLDVLEETF